MSDNILSDCFGQQTPVNNLIYRYRVERIKHNEKNLYANLFNQYRIFQGEDSYDELVNKFIDERLAVCEPVIFIALTNYPESIPVGFIQLFSKYLAINSIKTTIVNDLFVLEDYRNNGIALKLIEAAVKFAINNKSTVIQLETLKDNQIAQNLYESVGFKRQNIKSELNIYFIKLQSD